MKTKVIFLILLLGSQFTFAKSRVDTISVHATKMNKEVKAVVILPDCYNEKKSYPVVYILHGYSDNYAKWVNTVPTIKQLATEHQTIIVCPDGGFSSWYFDSPRDSTYQYESYIIRDLVPFIDSEYSTLADKKARAITGHSMGGHGALYLAIRNKEVFGNAGSMSGGVDLHASTRKYDIAKRIGNAEEYPEEWNNRSVVNMVDSLKSGELNLYIDCGVNDFFYEINSTLHRKLVSLKIAHDYTERPGIHNWDYWTNAIIYQMLYFKTCFKK